MKTILVADRKTIHPDDKIILQKIGEKVRALRKELHKPLTYIEFAEKISVSKNSYNQLENGKTYFSINLLLRVLKEHNKSLNDFFTDFE